MCGCFPSAQTSLMLISINFATRRPFSPNPFRWNEAFCAKACDTGVKLKSGELPWQSAPDIEKRFVKRLSNICKKPLPFKSAETLRSYLAGPEQKFLFTFLRHQGVPTTTNHAELYKDSS